MLTDAPTVAGWLRVHLPSGTAHPVRNDAEMRRASATPPLPLDLGILDLLDRWEVSVTGWVDQLCESVGLTGPDAHDVGTCARFLTVWLPTIADQDWTEDLWFEVAELTSDSHALAPWRPTMRRVDGVPCPGCNAAALVVFGGEDDVTCLECREIIPPARYNLWTRIALEEAVS